VIVANLTIRKLAKFRILAGVFISAALAPAMCAQAPRQLQVEVGPNQQVRILASDVSYGEVLRALQRKLGWEIEIPPLADELKLSYVYIETTQPQIALARLLEGSRLGYAFLVGVNGSRSMKAVVIPSTPREARVTQETASNSPIPGNAVANPALPPPAEAQAVTTVKPNAPVAGATPGRPEVLPMLPLSEEIRNAIGVPPGVSPADVGITMTFPIGDAARIMEVSPGVPPSDIGKTTTMPLPTGPGKRP
jgi:hypothetical protein